MKFDAVVGNPPYQLNDGSSALPIYNMFVEQAKKINPRYITMITPARWYSGGKGLDEFRATMLHDDKIAVIHDFPETSDCFPGINIRGGVCYFLWNNHHITKNLDWKDKIKVLVSKASPGGDEYPHSIIFSPVLAEKNSVCTETYLIVDFVNNEEEGKNLISYMNTKFFRFMMSLIKNTQNISKGVFAFVPV